MITLNETQHDIEALHTQFKEEGVVRVFDFLNLDSAETLSTYIQNEVEYRNAFFLDQQNREATDDDIARITPEQRRDMYQGIYKLAAQGVGFLYGRHKVSLSSPKPLSSALDLLNNVSAIDLVKSITADESIKYSDAQVTRYRVGDFLTRHSDNVASETRKIAYVLSLSKEWHPDWGGLLQFFQPDGTPQKSWSPIFNSLTLFDVNKAHSVTSITPFSPQSRYSITGWYRA